MNVRVRFPPSPTGPLHMGNVRTLLFNFLFAKKEGGVCILRVEDTDKERSKKEWEQDIIENLQWLGITWDEGPYRQSERTEIYKKYLEKLLKENKAYWCFCSEDILETVRQEQQSRGEAPRYPGICREIPTKEQEDRIANGEKGVVRFIVEPKKVSFTDLIRGEIVFDMALSGDIVIAKDMETPLYNFTAAVDDREMRITHVIRGEDHITNTPKQILLWEALGFGPAPLYAHLPLIMAEDHTKLSKRHGNNSVTRYRQEGYLPSAIINFLALLGWNPGDNREIFSLQELCKEFSLERVQKSPAVFSLERLDWINGEYIRVMAPDTLLKACAPFLPDTASMNQETLAAIVLLQKERLKKLSNITELSEFFFAKKLTYDTAILPWKGAALKATKNSLEATLRILEGIEENDWNKERLETILMPEARKTGDRGAMLWPLRVALTGKKGSPGPFEVAAILGKEKSIARVKSAIEKLQ
ncbi:MAG: glutamate--tRNA ligase [Candidatus Wildermuthbacteria bacterium]|nr:glutamate--tRNA ligase [Candidatus Wildermuthbacteria bacterium]